LTDGQHRFDRVLTALRLRGCRIRPKRDGSGRDAIRARATDRPGRRRTTTTSRGARRTTAIHARGPDVSVRGCCGFGAPGRASASTLCGVPNATADFVLGGPARRVISKLGPVLITKEPESQCGKRQKCEGRATKTLSEGRRIVPRHEPAVPTRRLPNARHEASDDPHKDGPNDAVSACHGL
jgi:hypothetical protein